MKFSKAGKGSRNIPWAWGVTTCLWHLLHPFLQVYITGLVKESFGQWRIAVDYRSPPAFYEKLAIWKRDYKSHKIEGWNYKFHPAPLGTSRQKRCRLLREGDYFRRPYRMPPSRSTPSSGKKRYYREHGGDGRIRIANPAIRLRGYKPRRTELLIEVAKGNYKFQKIGGWNFEFHPVKRLFYDWKERSWRKFMLFAFH